MRPIDWRASLLEQIQRLARDLRHHSLMRDDLHSAAALCAMGEPMCPMQRLPSHLRVITRAHTASPPGHKVRCAFFSVAIILSAGSALAGGHHAVAPAVRGSQREATAPTLANVPAPQDSAAKDICPGVTKSVRKHVSTIQTLTQDVLKSKESLARSLAGVFQQLSGEDYTSPASRQKLQTIQSERRHAEDLNKVLGSLGCAKVDIDRELASKPANAGSPAPDPRPALDPAPVRP